MPMLMARSCPFQCSFCFHPMGKGYRSRSLDNFFKELDLWIEIYNINGIALIDECFSIDKNRVIEFCNRIKPYKINWACQMRADTYTDELLKAMKDSGCIGACFGIESMSEKVLKNMNKHLNKETIENALLLTYKYKIGCTGNFIFGSEVEDFSTISESIRWNYVHAHKYNNYPIRQFSYVQTYPGSIFFENACKKGIIYDRAKYIKDGKWDLNITDLSDEEYTSIYDITRLCRKENYNRGEIIDIKYTSEKTADFTFKCSYCGSINKYHNLNSSRLREGKIKRLGCRSCNILGDYILNEEIYMYDEYIAIQWFLDIVDIKIPKEYFYERSWFKIGLCGMNSYSKKLISILRNYSKLDLVFIFDYKINEDIDYYQVEKYYDMNKIPKVDIIINTDIAYLIDMDKYIRQYYDGTIIYLEKLLRKFYKNK